MAPMVLLLTASLTGAAITFALLWPWDFVIAVTGASLGGSLLTAAVALILWLSHWYSPQPDKRALSLTERPKSWNQADV
jgi:hypothetical protein